MIEHRTAAYRPSHTATYNHAVTGLTLSELYGMAGREADGRMGEAIDKALAVTYGLQDRANKRIVDEGGWCYWRRPTRRATDDYDSDLSVTSWHLMFLRSAKNAGFSVDSERIDRAMRFVLACHDRRRHVFRYHPSRDEDVRASMMGAGIVAMAHSGMFESDAARRAGDWLLAHPYTQYNVMPGHDRFHYSLFYTVPAMYMLGGRHWRQFYPRTVQTLLDHQDARGHWQVESTVDGKLGNVYTTALVVAALNTPNQLLPIFQR